MGLVVTQNENPGGQRRDGLWSGEMSRFGASHGCDWEPWLAPKRLSIRFYLIENPSRRCPEGATASFKMFPHFICREGWQRWQPSPRKKRCQPNQRTASLFVSQSIGCVSFILLFSCRFFFSMCRITAAIAPAIAIANPKNIYGEKSVPS